MKSHESPEIWFITGSQDLYGQAKLQQVAEHAKQIVDHLNAVPRLPLKLVFQPVRIRTSKDSSDSESL